MIELSKSKIDIPLEDSIPEARASLESILCTEELQRRPSRPPDYEKENRALVALVSALADSPSTVLQTLAETILDITQCDSAGLSLLTRDDGGKRFYWPAIAGMWNPHVGGGTPRNFGPCGDVLDQNRTLLFRHFERRYPYLMPVIPAAEECLLVPFYVAGQAVGTVWAIMHSDRRKFDAEDDRVMASLGKFASSAYQALAHIEDLKFQVAEREKAEAEVRELAKGLEAKIRRLVEANVVGIVMWNLEGAITETNEAFLRMVQYDREDLASGRVRWTDLTAVEWRGSDERAIADLNASGIFQPFEKEYFRKDGSRVPVLLGGALFKDSGNEGVAFVLDLSEQKRAQEALRRSEAYLTEAQRLSQTGSFGCRLSTGEMFWSEETFRIYGYDQSTQPSVERVLQRVHPEDKPLVQEQIDRASRGGTGCHVECRLLLPDDSVKHVRIVAHASKNESGIIEFIGAVMDVTAQRQARADLEKAFEEIKRLKDRLHDENVALREQIDQVFMFEEIVGSSPALKTVLSSIVKVAPTDSTVLITGETGTGKELIARAIHKGSQRASQAFVSVNCAAIPSSLIASELFGHEKGAFTGALQRRQGRFELAHSGTIFLDEIGELPVETQISLLRVLQERQFERVGGSRVIPTDVRIIVATNRDLAAAIASGAFRADLFYRLNIFPIHVPPLRNRKEDIPMLREYFVKRYAEKARKQISKIDKNTLKLCQSYHWPGNIRELQNIVERSVILCTGDTFWIDEAWLSSQNASRPVSSGSLPKTLQSYEKELIEAALVESNGKVAGPNGAAAKLGIPRSTLDLKIKQLNIKRNTTR